MRNPLTSKKKALRKEIKKKFIKSKRELEESFSPDRVKMITEMIQPLIQTFWQQRSNAQFDTVTQGDIYLYDFENQWGSQGTIGGALPMDGDISLTLPGLAAPKPIQGATPRAVVKPKDVLSELERIPDEINLEDLDNKILTLTRKRNLIKENHFAKAETIGMITRLENRKKYVGVKMFFGQFQNTDGKAIDALLGKYKLEMKSADLFVPEFPSEAVEIMTAYEAEVMKLCDKKPVFYVIAESADFQEKYKKRDPILLVQSPFGIYYQILGAWDKEMVLLSEL